MYALFVWFDSSCAVFFLAIDELLFGLTQASESNDIWRYVTTSIKGQTACFQKYPLHVTMIPYAMFFAHFCLTSCFLEQTISIPTQKIHFNWKATRINSRAPPMNLKGWFTHSSFLDFFHKSTHKLQLEF